LGQPPSAAPFRLLLALCAGRGAAQTVVVERVPTVTYYTPPAVVTPAPATVTTYRYGLLPWKQVTVVNYPAPVPAPVVTYPAPAPVVTYSSPAVYVPRPVRTVRYYGPVYVYP
jgi:hypothetical protein